MTELFVDGFRRVIEVTHLGGRREQRRVIGRFDKLLEARRRFYLSQHPYIKTFPESLHWRPQ
jgi:hypothetical protein